MHTRIRCFAISRIFKVLLPLLCALYSPGLWAEGFRVQDIRVQGLQRISEETLLEYLPIQPGDLLSDTKSPALLRALYETGFFNDIRLEREGEVLQVIVVERPSVASISFSGNKSLDDKMLRAALKANGLAEGKAFNKPLLARIERELEQQFFNQGKYSVKIATKVSDLERNRVAVAIDIVEGSIARIKRVNIVGNKAFSEKTLLSQMQLSTGGWLSAFTKDDQYSKQKLSGDLEALRAFYLDRGYVNFKISSTQVNVTPDKSGIYITVNVDEGGVYKLTDIQLAGSYIGKVDPYFAAIQLRRGEAFNRRLVVDSTDRLSRLLADQGYAFAKVNAIPEIDEQNKTIALTFMVDPGQRVYVRRVNIQGNSRTRDEVIRREFRQMEATWFSSEKLRLSRERVQRTGYFDSINISTPAVPGSADQVDVNVQVTEKPSGALLAGVGFSQSQGIVLNASISQENFFGTGKQVSLALKTSKANQHYEVAYTNPYYTVDGISRGFQLSYRSTDFDELDTADYKTSNGIAGVSFGIPLSEFNRLKVGIKAHHIDFKLGSNPSSQVFNWVALEGDRYLNFEADLSWRHDSRDSAWLPTQGALQHLGMEVAIPGSTLNYYKFFYKYRHYWALPKDWVFSVNGELGYGDAYGDTSQLPFFENFYVGGPRSVRGFKSLSLGPRDSTDDPLGGNAKLLGNAELYFPPLYNRSMRLLAFVDAGNVYDTEDQGIQWDKLRYSAGIGLSWLSPIGPLTLSFARPINLVFNDKDKKESFQFSLGTTF
jgi:outer membrane protein insertion porin family